MPNYELVNKKSGAKATVTELEWEQIKKKGWAGRFTFKMQSITEKKPPFTPKEVIDMREKKSPVNENNSETMKEDKTKLS
jgi:hypothetical protein